MSKRAEQFAVQFEAVNEAAIAVVSGCTDEEWRRTCASEGWSVGVVAHHVAVVQQAFVGILETLAAGEMFSPRSGMEAVHRSNAQHARDYATVGKPETLDPLQTSGTTAAHLIRSLDDAQLDRIAGHFGERELTVAQVVEGVVIGHAAEHLASIHATIVGSAVDAN